MHVQSRVTPSILSASHRLQDAVGSSSAAQPSPRLKRRGTISIRPPWTAERAPHHQRTLHLAPPAEDADLQAGAPRWAPAQRTLHHRETDRRRRAPSPRAHMERPQTLAPLLLDVCEEQWPHKHRAEAVVLPLFLGEMALKTHRGVPSDAEADAFASPSSEDEEEELGSSVLSDGDGAEDGHVREAVRRRETHRSPVRR